jgi:hypothetical protein
MPKVTLKAVVTGGLLEIPAGGCLIGRGSSFASELFNHKWVSDPHCKISLAEGACLIEDIGSEGMGSTNGTFLNGDRLPPRTPVRLADGGKIRIAHLMFDVMIEASPENCPAGPEGGGGGEALLTWVIDCPVCGKRFSVEDGAGRVLECDACGDPVDRRQIAKIRPKQVRVRA